MLHLLLGSDWIANRDEVLRRVAQDVAEQKGGRILMVPELISHDTERRLCAAAGDTASRFAEVLTFTRLTRRVADAAEVAPMECLDNGGRLVAMASSARQLSSRLKAYASVETRPEFLTALVDAVDECKRCLITWEDLRAAAQKTQGSLAQKLEELSVLLEHYDGLCARGKRDPRDQMTWLLALLEDSDFAAAHTFYIDGFPDFTRQHLAILAHLIANAADVTVSLNCDSIRSGAMAFEKAGGTAYELKRMAQQAGIPVQITVIAPRPIDPLYHVRMRLFQGPITVGAESAHLTLTRCDCVYDECAAAAERAAELVRAGSRYRQIGVVCPNDAGYRRLISLVFRRCGIPTYLSGTEDILEKTVLSTVLAAIDTVCGGFEQREVLRYLRSALSPLDTDTCDRLENYAVLWGIRGSGWKRTWEKHPDGLGKPETAQSCTRLRLLEENRRLTMEPLIRLETGFREAGNLAEQIAALKRFLEELHLLERLEALARQMDDRGDNRSAQELDQLWEILQGALDQMCDVLGDTAWDTETFNRLLRLLLSQYDVGTIPPVLDAVAVGSVQAMRCQQVKHLIVLGAAEGVLPAYGGSKGVLTDAERTQLRKLGLPLTGGGIDGVQTEFSEIYGVFCGAEETVMVTVSGSQPSYLYSRLAKMAGAETSLQTPIGAAGADRREAGALLAALRQAEAASALSLEEEYEAALEQTAYALGSVSQETVTRLYGKILHLSASQIDRQAECRLSYFLRYGLRAEERKEATVDPAEFGTYVHDVLEHTVAAVMERGGFHRVSLEETQNLANGFAESYENSYFSQLDSGRTIYLFRRNRQELGLIVQELWQELHGSQFEPVGEEVKFDADGMLPAVSIEGSRMKALLRGFVDRVDVWQSEDRAYYRVVDYKTGKKDFDYCDVFNGVGLQMLLYLFALRSGGAALVGANAEPAGVQYFPARVPLIPADGELTEAELRAKREKLWKRKGLLLRDEGVLAAMQAEDGTNRLCCSRNKDGELTGDLAGREDFAALRQYVFRLLGKLVDEIASGSVEANPYTRGASHDACAFCPYASVCRKEEVAGRRNYKRMDAPDFWERVRRELNANG